MNDIILFIITSIITFIFGLISKKSSRINNKLIPIQNLVIGITVAIVDFIITKDFKLSLIASGLFAGGAYDIFHNFNKIYGGEE